MWSNPKFPADLATFTEEILNGKLHFLCSAVNDFRKKLYHRCLTEFEIRLNMPLATTNVRIVLCMMNIS